MHLHNMLHHLLEKIRNWRKQFWGHPPLITIEISRETLLHNLQILKNVAPNWGVAPVLKSNAYGHGLVPVAKILEDENIPFVCIDSLFEAEVLRNYGIQKPLLVLGYTTVDTIAKNKLKNVSFTIASLEGLREFAKKLNRGRIHIKFDTGMHRRGISLKDISTVIELIKEHSLAVEGILSHFAESYRLSDVTKKQITLWNDLVLRCKKELPNIAYYHIANSGGFTHANLISANVGRSGVAFYGYAPEGGGLDLRPALRMKTIVSDVKEVPEGETVGYDSLYKTTKQTKIAIIPVGYFEGIDRKLSNKGIVRINGHDAGMTGRVSMNISMYDVTNIPNVSEGTPVVVFSHNPSEKNSFSHSAVLAGTSVYELLIHLPSHLRRDVVASFE